jgi:hypothetical protein
MAKQPLVGTIIGVFNGALDGLPARLVRRRQLGYTVELLEARGRFQAGTLVHLSFAEFLLSQARSGDVPGSPTPE